MKALDPTVREHARNRGELDGADAQALEHALTLTEIERDTARDQYVFMMQSAADEKLEADREIAERLADRVTTELFDQYGGVAPTEGPRRLPILR